jgi:hypothetical protein
LFAAVPPLFLFGQNAIQQVNLDPLWLPLVACVVAGALLAFLLAAFYRDWQRGALAASLILIGFFSFGHAANLLGAHDAARLWLAGGYVVLLLAGLVGLSRGRSTRIHEATRFANLVSLALVAINAAGVIGFAVGVSRIGTPGSAMPLQHVAAPAHKPDVYYIILDRYAGAQTLASDYGFDNAPFLDALKQRGFSVAADAWANYPKTAYSLVSSLNGWLLDPKDMGWTDPISFAPIHLALRSSLSVPVTFKQMGYEYVHIGNYWEPSATNVDADVSMRYGTGSEFAAALLTTTAWSLVQQGSAQDLDPETTELPALARATTLYEFSALREAATRPGPKFVFAHFLLPHPPYVFDADGSEPTADETRDRTDEEAYVQQLRWANDQLLHLVDDLLDVPQDKRPIVILQADEGPFPERFARDQENFNWLQATDAEVSQKYGILLAMALPDAKPEEHGFTDHTSPVNVFRVVLDAEFGSDLPVLPDDTYLIQDYRHLNVLIPYHRPQ